MTKAEIIAYAIAETIVYATNKECCRYSLVEWCEERGFSIEDLKKFIKYGKERFSEQEGGQNG